MRTLHLSRPDTWWKLVARWNNDDDDDDDDDDDENDTSGDLSKKVVANTDGERPPTQRRSLSV